MSEKTATPVTASSTTEAQPPAAEESNGKSKPGASWKAGEQQIIPKNRIGIVFFGLMLTVFLAALDQVCHLHFTLEAPTVLTSYLRRPLLQQPCLQ